MFNKVLIANRGEIALRVIRACRELGVQTVAVYSEADRESLHVRFADDDVCIGPAPARESYLNIPRLIAAAEITGADAIHPGYGFLAENAHFAEIASECRLTFIGPSPNAIRLMGDKAVARDTAKAAGVPILPGSDGPVRTFEDALEVAKTIGFPVILKAAAGGGGRGMRIVWTENELAAQYLDAAREAKAAFNDDSIYVEKYLTAVRHIEIQVLSDGRNVLHLGERDCSIQRRNQKLLEESPSPVLDDTVRAQIGEAAVRLCKHVGYTSAGTIECILDGSTGRFYFMEMNTRVQVEHPVSELVTGVDIVREQIRIARGEPLAFSQSDIRLSGHAIECRINAEDPANGFAPCPGLIEHFHAPGGPGIRVDSHVYAGYRIPPYYDSLLAKVIAWDKTREGAVARMHRALSEMRIDGVRTTLPFHLALLRNDRFRRGDVHTKFVENELLETK
jgi:acetyl-CoA carboxylase biotin carboxylase subunit